MTERRVVVVTGASDGIGAELARQWAARHRERVALVLAARDVGKLEAVAASCRAHSAEAMVRRTDVTDEAQCRGLVADTITAHGRLDTLVLNAGMSAHARFADVADLGWYEDLMRLNLWGSVWCTHAALPHLVATHGQVVAVSSLAGLVGVPERTAYCASKFAMTGFFEALRVEVAPQGVGVTLAYPGVVATEIRRRGYDAAGRAAGRSGLDESKAMPVEVCARLILDGADRRARDVVMTTQGRLGRWLKLIAPGAIDRAGRRALNRDRHRPPVADRAPDGSG